MGGIWWGWGWLSDVMGWQGEWRVMVGMFWVVEIVVRLCTY